MPNLTIAKNNFTAGEISPDLWGRADLQGYMNGAARLRNVLLRPTGGVTRRPGLRHVAALSGISDLRLVAFAFNTAQTYLLVLSALRLRVYRDDVEVFNGAAPWTAAMVPHLSWSQSADTLFVCHPDMPPHRVTRLSHTDWKVEAFAFAPQKVKEDEDDEEEEGVETGAEHRPMFKFAKPDVTLTPTATSGTVTLIASADVFLSEHADVQFRIKKKGVKITSVTDSRNAQATVLQAFDNTNPTADWEEAAFSPVRGWPICVTLYQERLVFAGSRELPNRVWLSKTSDIDNFDLGKGLDDESIEFALLTDQVDAIRAVVAGRHLQLFTSGAEWMVTGEPLTPTKLRAERQTRIGSFGMRTIPPRHVDGATLFLGRSGKELREFLYTDIDQAYTAADLALLSNHVFTQPVDQDYAQQDRLFMVVMDNGTIAALTVYRAQQVTAWTVFETAGAFRAIAVVETVIYVAVERDGLLRIERFVPDVFTDAHVAASDDGQQTVWSGLDHLEGREVAVVADGLQQGNRTVSEGRIVLAQPAGRVEIGLPYGHEIRPLPPELGNGQITSQARPVRLVRAVFRLHQTKALQVDIGQGLRPMAFGRSGDALDVPAEGYSGDLDMRGLGWVRGPERPLWRIAQDMPQPCTLLSVMTEVKGAE